MGKHAARRADAFTRSMREHNALGPCAALAFSFCLGVNCLAAQESQAAQCIASMHRDYGGSPALRGECVSRQDCLYQAPAGNASALALLNAMADRVQECWRAAGLAMTDEQRERQGVIRTYAKPGETCKMLLSLSFGAMAYGFRAACQSDPPR
jgi:hypothetical protein